MLRHLFGIVGLAGCTVAAWVAPAGAQQTVFAGYAVVRDTVFWSLFYVLGGATLYCEIPFDRDGNLAPALAGERLTIEHVYPQQWIAEHFGCARAAGCTDPRFRAAAADLHNLWPALGRINASRGQRRFGEIEGETDRRFEAFCADYERAPGRNGPVEPRDGAKGDIARALLYMADAYGVPLRGGRDTARRWHAADPPDAHERWRNTVIGRLQGNGNTYIGDEGVARDARPEQVFDIN